MIAPNTIVGGRYRVVKPLGGGGMKLVYLAEDLRLAARRCALAEVVDNFTDPNAQRQAIASFEREADMLARLSNEHIPRVFDRFSEQNHHYLVMEYIDGVTLEEEMTRAGGRLPETRVIDIALQVLDTLEYLHGLEPPVIYRDLKPSNVMLTGGGQAKLIDFGIARHFQPQQNATMIGTQGYAPPEQYRGKVELRSDIYALGATIHHALSGRDPANEAPFSFPPLHTLCPSAEPALAALVDDALAYDVERRVPSAAEFKRRLQAIRDGVAAVPAADADSSTAAATHAAGTYGAAGDHAARLAQASAGTTAGAHASAPTPGAAGTPSAASGSRRAQLRLPLSAGHAAPQAGPPSAPTVLSAASEIACPTCTRAIPSDSRFCSFCGADLSVALGADAAPVSHEADTVVLSLPPRERPRTPPPGARLYHRTRGMRRPILLLVLIFAGAFAAVKFISCLSMISGGSPYANRAPVAPPMPAPAAPAYPGYGAPPAADYRAARLTAFRQALDIRGYNDVRFKMIGDTMQLWGTVPDSWDHIQVEILANTIVGVVSFDDHIEVRDASAPP
jgi:predicted Ser/Thr protein kinase